MVRPKQVPTEERETVTHRITLKPCFAAVSDLPSLRGISGVGWSEEDALASLRSEVRRRFPNNKYDIVENL